MYGHQLTSAERVECQFIHKVCFSLLCYSIVQNINSTGTKNAFLMLYIKGLNFNYSNDFLRQLQCLIDDLIID